MIIKRNIYYYQKGKVEDTVKMSDIFLNRFVQHRSQELTLVETVSRYYKDPL